MALFKMLHGNESNISTDVTPFHEGWCYITHDGCFYVDLNIGTEESPNNQRIKLNAEDAETLTGMSVDEVRGIYVGGGDMPEGYIVQLDLNGENGTCVLTVNGQSPDKNGNISIDVPTKVSQLENDGGYIKKTVTDLAYYYNKDNSYDKEEVNDLIDKIPKFSIKVVETLPEAGIDETTVYLLKSGEETNNLYHEYIYVNGIWEALGSQTVDLTDYALVADVPSIVYQTLEYIYPVGAIYISASNINPAEIFKFGEWEQIKDRFLLSAGDNYIAGSTGGEASHQLVPAELPAIGGYIRMHNVSAGTPIEAVGSLSGYTPAFSATNTVQNLYRDGGSKVNSSHSIGGVNMTFGENLSHNNMPPYLTVYVWQRIS